MKILLVEDEIKLARSIARQLEKQNMTVEICFDGKSGFEMASQNKFDIIILDWRLPEKSGIEICEDVRKTDISTPILMLTAMDSVQHRVKALETCADDYLCKPFDFSELVARIHSLYRRSKLEKNTTLEIDDLVIDTSNRHITRNNKRIFLSTQEYELLEFLMLNLDKPQSREVLLKEVWGLNFSPESNIVDVYINYLRNKLHYNGANSLIHSVRGIGYKISIEQ